MAFTFPRATDGVPGAIREDAAGLFHVPVKLYDSNSTTVLGGANPITVKGTRTDGASGYDPPVIVGGFDGTATRVAAVNGSGQLIIESRISQSAPGTTNFVEGRFNTRRAAAVLHRNGVTAADTLAVPTVSSRTGATVTGGSLSSGGTYYCTVAAANRWGATPVATIASTSPGGTNNAIEIAWSAVTGAEAYDLFLSTDTQPKWVARVTEAQRAAGGVITTVGQASPAAGGSAGSITIGVEGTEVAANAHPFLNNNAYRPDNVTPIDCTGYQLAHVLVRFTPTDLRVQPSVTLVPFLRNSLSPTNWHQSSPIALPFLTGRGTSLCQEFYLAVNGCSGLVLAIDELIGNGSVSIWVQLC